MSHPVIEVEVYGDESGVFRGQGHLDPASAGDRDLALTVDDEEAVLAQHGGLYGDLRSGRKDQRSG